MHIARKESHIYYRQKVQYSIKHLGGSPRQHLVSCERVVGGVAVISLTVLGYQYPCGLLLVVQPEGAGRLVVLGLDLVQVEAIQRLSRVLRAVLDVLEVGPVASEPDAERTTGRTGEQHENAVGGEAVALRPHLAVEDGTSFSLLDGLLEQVSVERPPQAGTVLLLRLEDDARDGVVAAMLDRRETEFELY